jgi:hypothetical protein
LTELAPTDNGALTIGITGNSATGESRVGDTLTVTTTSDEPDENGNALDTDTILWYLFYLYNLVIYNLFIEISYTFTKPI